MITKENYQRIRKILKGSLHAGIMILAINLRAVSIIRYGAGIDLRKNEIEAIDRKTRKLLMICRSLHPRSDIDRLYCKRKNGAKGLISVEECVRIEKKSLGFYLKEQEHKLLTEVVWEGVILDNE